MPRGAKVVVPAGGAEGWTDTPPLPPPLYVGALLLPKSRLIWLLTTVPVLQA